MAPTTHTLPASGSSASIKGLLDSSYARDKKALMATINDIRSTGAAVDIDLPTIVVAGNQSSGKSSLIEAISGINLPRALGTCTRVPIEVRLRQEEVPWSCAVKVRWVRAEGKTQPSEEAKEVEVPFGPLLTDPSLVESTIRRAQLGILNRSVDLQRFVTYKFPSKEEVQPLGSTEQDQFSKSVIVLEITGPDQTDLTLVDLPGIIQNAGSGGDANTVSLIEDMVNSYIEKDCLILLVITMMDDLKNQKAVALARAVDPQGKRTIGVLTKVDTVRGRAETLPWLDLINGVADPLKHGYFVTRQPDADTLAAHISFAAAREQEERFFREQAPWIKYGLASPPKIRLGTKNLSAFLSDQLSALIKAKLPEVEQKIIERYHTLDHELKALGEPPITEASVQTLLDILTAFERSIDQYTKSDLDCESFVRDARKAFDDFPRRLKATAPTLIPLERPTMNANLARLEQIKQDCKVAIHLDQMRQFIENYRGWELPLQIPQRTLGEIVHRSTKTWKQLSLDLLDRVKPILDKAIEGLISKHFGKFGHGQLLVSVDATMTKHIDHLFHQTRSLIDDLVRIEQLDPFTVNTPHLEHALIEKRYELSAKRSSLKRKRDDEAASTSKKAGLGIFASRPTSPTAADVVGLDEYAIELDLMAQISAYWNVAYKRTMDNIPNAIRLKLLHPLATGVHTTLAQELKVHEDGAQERCRAYLAEAPIVAEQRADLAVRMARLEEARVALRKFRLK